METQDCFAPWQNLLSRLETKAPDRIVVWVSASGADHVFLRMACHRLRFHHVPLAVLAVPAAAGGYAAVGAHRQADLAGFHHQLRIAGTEERGAWAAAFETILARPEPLRLIDATNQLGFHGIAHYDETLLDQCTNQWRPCARVVGQVMAEADRRNPVGDVLLASRLGHLASLGKVVLQHAKPPLPANAVKRA